MLKVFHIAATADGGWEAAGARLLHESLAGAEYMSFLAAAEVTNENKHGIEPLFASQTEDTDNVVFTERVQQLLASADIVHLHMGEHKIVGMTLAFINRLDQKPVVFWSLTDCSAYTGICRLPLGCDNNWLLGCRECPLEADKAVEERRAAKLLEIKQKFLASLPLNIICHSSWQGEQLRRSVLADKPRFLIRRAVNPRYFYSGSKSIARQSLGLSIDSLVIVCEYAGDRAFEEVYKCATSLLDFARQIELILLNGKSVKASRSVEKPSAAMRGEYYRAADLYIDFRSNGFIGGIVDAAACGCPTVALANEAVQSFVNSQNGFLLNKCSARLLLAIIAPILRNNADFSLSDKAAACLKDAAAYDAADCLDKHRLLYSHIRPEFYKDSSPMEKAVFNAVLTGNLQSGLEGLLENADKKKKAAYDNIVDRYCLGLLQVKDSLTDSMYIWNVISLWYSKRLALDLKQYELKDADGVYSQLIILLRQQLVQWFKTFGENVFAEASAVHINVICHLWQNVFLNSQSFLHTMLKAPEGLPDFAEYDLHRPYPYVLMRSMYVPYYDGEPGWNIKAILESPQRYMMFIFTMWLTNTPLYDATKKHEAQALYYIEKICRELISAAKRISKADYCFLQIYFMQTLWRISYIGGNIVAASRAYGDWLQTMMAQFYPQYAKKLRRRKRRKNDKIRLGYFSVRFYHSAVCMYMGNRIIQHDRDMFDVTVISCSALIDSYTEQLKANCDNFLDLSKLEEKDKIAEFARIIYEQKFDIIIYPDIGMDEVTCQLGAMHLAPVQLCMMGHCMTSGLSSIDYYIAGDHEPEAAQECFVEKLVRLPVLGAAQLPPRASERVFKRAEFGVPDDAVVMVSAANALKHGLNRDRLLIEILQRVPNSYIILKPFQSKQGIDNKFIERITQAAASGGVSGRIKVVYPFNDSGDLKGFYQLADMQLDTYPTGGWTSNLEAFYYHVPTVTQEGDIGRSRWGAAMLRAMGIEDGIAADEREYVEWAVKMASDSSLRASLRSQLAAKVVPTLFNPVNGQAEFEALLKSLVK